MIKIKFQYEMEQIKVTRDNNPLNVLRPMTHCQLKHNEEVIGKSTVRLHQDDRANKIEARTFAFKKAVKQITSKEVRRELWNQFRTTMNQVDRRLKDIPQEEQAHATV